MAIFFFAVALETKRELICGNLCEARKAALPVAAALGGYVLPLLVSRVQRKREQNGDRS